MKDMKWCLIQKEDTYNLFFSGKEIFFKRENNVYRLNVLLNEGFQQRGADL